MFAFVLICLVIVFAITMLFITPTSKPSSRTRPVPQPSPVSRPRPARRPARPVPPPQPRPQAQHHRLRPRPHSIRVKRDTRCDLVGLVAFHDRGFVMAKPAEPHAAWLGKRVAALPSRVSGSSTNITDGLRKAVELLKKTPRGRLRRIWLLTDGMPNRERNDLMKVVADARRHYININTIGFGDPGASLYDPALLKQIAKATHNGHFVAVNSLRQLSNALKNHSGNGINRRKPETTIMAIDCSGSMLLPMENKRRIDVVVEAITHLLHYKQKCFS